MSDLTRAAFLKIQPYCHAVYIKLLDVYIAGTDPLVADFTADVETGDAPLTVTFTDASTGADVTELHWDYGDGTTHVGSAEEHIYTEVGDYTVTLEIVTTFGVTSTEVKVDFISAVAP